MTAELQDWNAQIVAEFRSHAGVVAWSDEEDLARGRPIPGPLPGFDPDTGAPIILVTHVGARSGRRRTNPLMFQAVGPAFAVFATFGGSPRPPAWYRNVEAHPTVLVESGTDVLAAAARTAEGGERERIWDEQVRRMPAFADFESTAGRQIPVVVLTPTAGAPDTGPSRR